MTNLTFFKLMVISTILIVLSCNAQAMRIKDFVNIQGVRQNQLIGYGLVIGLDATGDSKNSEFTFQSLASLLERMGMTVSPGDVEKVKSVAAVMVTAELLPFARVGSRTDVMVSSIGDAQSLRGGTLLFTPLKGADGNVYAVAQGPVSIGGGFTAGGKGGSIQKNFPTVGRVPSGALIEREVAFNFNTKKVLNLTLNSPDFTTACRVADAINMAEGVELASTCDAGAIEVKVPQEYWGRVVQFVTRIESLSVAPDSICKVVVNERTGTVVMGQDVRISTVGIAHGNLSVEIKESNSVSQPLPFSNGETTVTPETEMLVKEESTKIFVVRSGVSIGDVVRALNALGVSPRDLIAIFQAIKAAGALHARLEII